MTHSPYIGTPKEQAVSSTLVYGDSVSSLHKSPLSLDDRSQLSPDQLNEEADKYTAPRRPWRYHVTPFSRILRHQYEGEGTKDNPYQISWLPKDDPENPLTYSGLKRWSLAIFVSIATLAVTLSSSAYSGAMRSIALDLGGSDESITLGVALFVVGFAFGPLFWAPLSELYGRRALFISSYAFMTLFNSAAVASKNLGTLVALRFLAGVFGSSPLTNAAGSIADCFEMRERGLAMCVFASAPFIGPALGPILGGFIAMNAGWKWVMGFLAIFSGVLLILGVLFFEETYAPVLLRWRAAQLSKVTGKQYICKMDVGKNIDAKCQFKMALSRPWQLLFREPIVLTLALYISIVVGTLYSFFSAFPIVFQGLRGWNEGIGSLSFVGVLAGSCLGMAFAMVVEHPLYTRKMRASETGVLPPEERLFSAMVGAPFITIGLAIFAGTGGKDVHWFWPIFSGFPFGFGMVLIFLALTNYLIDSYVFYAASVLAATSVIRSLFSAAFPMFTKYMYAPVNCPLESCGVHVGAAIACALSLLCVPFPYIFYKTGAKIRSRCKYSAEAARVLKLMLDGMQAKKQKDDKESA